MTNFLTLSASALARMVRRREASSEEIVQAHISRIQAVNPIINAMVRDRFDLARHEAKNADRIVRETLDAESLPPFHGVPFSVKESIALTGMPNAAGLVARRAIISSRDATVVLHLRLAGAIPLGVTNTSELCMWMETNNRVYGRTNNPYDPRRIAGGSSGGEGALVGAGGSPFGIGSDIGGSIRMPAFFCNVFGHKPSAALVSNDGQYPTAHGKMGRYLATGPLCRRAEDLMPLLRLMAGPKKVLQDPESVPIEGMKVMVVHGDGRHSVSRELMKAQHAAARYLASQGAHVTENSFSALRSSFEIWSAFMSEEGGNDSFRALLSQGKQVVKTVPELLGWILRRSDHTLPAILLAAIESMPMAKSTKNIRRFVRLGEALKKDLFENIAPAGVILYPPYPAVAPRHYKPMWPPFNWVYTAIWNVLEAAVTQVPLGLNRDGLPLGVQVIGLPGQDHVTIRVAMELERAFLGWVPPPW